MPLDGTAWPLSTALAKMDRVIDLIGEERRWCKHQAFYFDGLATRYCIAGAIAHAGGRAAIRPVVERAIREVAGRHRSIEAFNDAAKTDHALVLTVLRRARGIILGEPAPRLSWLRRLLSWWSP
jgi:hypothetical protein